MDDVAGFSSLMHIRGRLQAALTDAVELSGKPVSRRSIDSPHASRHSLGVGAAAVDGDDKAAKAVAPYLDAQVGSISRVTLFANS